MLLLPSPWSSAAGSGSTRLRAERCWYWCTAMVGPAQKASATPPPLLPPDAMLLVTIAADAAAAAAVMRKERRMQFGRFIMFVCLYMPKQRIVGICLMTLMYGVLLDRVCPCCSCSKLGAVIVVYLQRGEITITIGCAAPCSF